MLNITISRKYFLIQNVKGSHYLITLLLLNVIWGTVALYVFSTYDPSIIFCYSFTTWSICASPYILRIWMLAHIRHQFFPVIHFLEYNCWQFRWSNLPFIFLNNFLCSFYFEKSLTLLKFHMTPLPVLCMSFHPNGESYVNQLVPNMCT